ncbi:multidrug effflux MFS transporter [Roseateles sp. BYS96W]|uniref:Bcr/CflA family efflux transporter n=1 Tax=Pelomonas nitida TaxID=3299027 RepID=A0ABW7GC83_9BURK
MPRPATTATPTAPPAAAGWVFMALLAALMAFTSLSTDIYLPAMPQMQHDLGGDVELTIAGFLVGFAVAQLVWGPVSDRIGRRRPLVMGVLLFIVGSVGCALAQTLPQMVAWRVVQAFGACTGPMLARAMVRDLFARTQAAQTLSTLTVVMAIAPIVGPLLGGQVVRISNWHAVFWLLAAIGVLMLLALRALPETLPTARRATTPWTVAPADYLSLLRNRAFMGYTLSITFFYMGAYVFIVGSPFVYLSHFHVDPQHYGWLFGINIVGVMALSAVNRRLVNRFSLDVLLRAATGVAALAMAAGVTLVAWHPDALWAFALPVFVFFATNGIAAATSTAAALDAAPRTAGSAAALIGALQYGSGIVSSVALAALRSRGPLVLVLLMGLFATASAAMAFWRAPSSRNKEFST